MQADVPNDRQGGVKCPAGGDQYVVASFHDIDNFGTHFWVHVAIEVHDRAVYV